jgi:hypothetical protein
MRQSTSLRFAVGQSFPFWQISVVCDDGVAVADILANRLYAQRRTQWPDTLDGVASAARTGVALAGGSIRRRLRAFVASRKAA